MKRWTWRFGLKDSKRLGFSQDPPDDKIQVKMLKWYLPVGSALSTDASVVQINAKGVVDILPEGDEIGATLKEVLFEENQTIEINFCKELLEIAVLEREDLDADSEEGKAGAELANEKSPAPAQRESTTETELPPRKMFQKPRGASPLAIRLAQQAGVDIETIRKELGISGEERVGKEDVERFLKTRSVPERESGSSALMLPWTRKYLDDHGLNSHDPLLFKEATGNHGFFIRQDAERVVALAQKTEKIDKAPTDGTSSREGASPRPEIAPENIRSEYRVLPLSTRQWITAHAMEKGQEAPQAGPGIDINLAPLREYVATYRNLFKETGVKLRMDHLVAAACTSILARIVPREGNKHFRPFGILNARFYRDGKKEEIRLFEHVHMGMAVSIPGEKTESGYSELVVVSIKSAETLKFSEFVREAERVILDAQNDKSKNMDVTGATFIVNNTGAPVGEGIPGDEYPEPILPPDLAAMVAYGAQRKKDGLATFAMRFDHRVSNGREPIAFLRELQRLLEKPDTIPLLF